MNFSSLALDFEYIGKIPRIHLLPVEDAEMEKSYRSHKDIRMTID